MDVTCQRCKAEYEFDETLLGAKGTTVKCSSCGHVFRVLPPEDEQGRTPLKLRFAKDGSIRAIASLRELQQLIRAGEVGLDDELGRDGSPFRRLRELPELKNFFARAPEKTTVRPEPGAVPPPQGTGQAAGRPAAERTPAMPGRAETLLGTSPTARPPATFTPARSPEPEVGAELLDAPTVVAPIPEEIREARAAQAAQTGKRTMMGVGPLGPAQFDGGRPSSPGAANLGADRPSVPGRVDRESAGRRPASNANPAATLVGAPARAFPAVPEAGAPLSAHEREAGSPRGPLGEAAPPPVVAPRYGGEPAGLSGVEPGASAYDAQQHESAWESPQSSDESEGAAASPVRLYLEDDEIPRERISKSSSTMWVALALAALVVGGWFVMTAWQNAQRKGESPSTTAEPGAPDAALASSLTAAAQAESAAQASADAAAPAMPDAAASAPSAAEEQPSEGPVAGSEEAKPAERAATERDAQRGERASAPADEKRAKKTAPEATGEREEEAEAAASDRAEPTRRSASEPKSYAEWVSRGDQLASKGDHDGAAKAYEAALAERPTGSEANSGLGFSLLQRGRPRDALPHFDRAASSGFAEANVGLGDVYRKLGQPSSALEAYETYLERLPNGARAEYARGWIARLKGGGSAPASDEPEAAPPPGAAPPPAAEAPDDTYRPAGELFAPSPETNSSDESAQ